jgi:hypothetical protein
MFAVRGFLQFSDAILCSFGVDACDQSNRINRWKSSKPEPFRWRHSHGERRNQSWTGGVVRALSLSTLGDCLFGLKGNENGNKIAHFSFYA